MTQKYGWITFALCYLIANKEQQNLQQLDMLRSLYWRSLLPHNPQHTVEDAGKYMLKKQKRLKSGSAVISVTNGAVEIVKTYRLHLLLILIFAKNVIVGFCDCSINFVLYIDTTLIFTTLKNLIMFFHSNNIEHKTCKKS